MSSAHSRSRTVSGKARGRRRALGLTAAVLLAGTGCGQIPTSGPVYHYEDGPQATATVEPLYTPEGPKEDATPQEILQGFLEAGTGLENDYAVAREYLTPGLAGTWRPEARTLVHQGEITLANGSEEGDVDATVPASTVIDDRGIATSYSDPERIELNAEFEQIDGQWRISRISDGTVVSQQQFEQLFRSFNLYFYDPTFTYAVPDVRWFANRSTVPTSLVSALLKGPAPYLEGAAVSAVPGETMLLRPSVPISGETAEIDLTGEAVGTASQLSLERIHTQLEQTLEGVSAVSTVRLSVDERAVETGRLDDYRKAEVNPQVPQQQVGVEDGQLVGFAGNSVETLSQAAPLLFDPHDPVMDAEREVFAYLDEQGQRVGLSTSPENSREIEAPGALTGLSLDPVGHLWAASPGGAVWALEARDEDGEFQSVEVPWLEDQRISSLRISRDGTRALVVTGEGEEARVWVSGIERDEDGSPRALREPLRVGATIHPTRAQWLGDSEIVVADTAGDSVQIVSLSGEVSSANGLTDIENISTGNDRGAIYAQTPTDTFVLTGSSWTRLETDVRDLTFAG